MAKAFGETPPATPEAAAAECACHGPVVVAATEMSPGSYTPRSPRVVLTPVTYADGSSYREDGRSLELWQVDFRDLRWSVPGGMNVQFGVFGLSRTTSVGSSKSTWYSHASRTTGKHEFRLFRTGGKPFVPADGTHSRSDSIGINVQVWGHMTAAHP
jgi:hypothetical protein